MKSRRHLMMGGIGVLSGLAGCLSLGDSSTRTEAKQSEVPDRDLDGVPDKKDDYPDKFAFAHEVKDLSKTVDIPPAEYKAYSVRMKRFGFLKYDVLVEGGTIDVFLMSSEDYTKWQKNDDDAQYIAISSSLDTASAAIDHPMGPGDFVFVLDHTKTKTNPNPEPVTVDFELTAGIGSEESESEQ